MTTVLVPVYNGAHVLPRTVPAVLAQEGVDEFVWVDDGSTDGTGDLLQELVGAERRAQVVRLPENAGRSAARNRGLDATTGDVVVFFDADVRPPPDAARRLAEAARQPGAVAAIGRVRPHLEHPDDPYHVYLAHQPRGERGAEGDVGAWQHWVTCVAAARRDALDAVGRFDEPIPYGEDFAVACRLGARHPDGLRVVDVAVEQFDVPTLEGALDRMRTVGRAFPEIARRCPSAWRLAGIERAAASPVLRRLARVPVPLGPVRRALRALPPVGQARAVRYLLGHALLSALAGAPRRSSPSDPVGGAGGRLRRG